MRKSQGRRDTVEEGKSLVMDSSLEACSSTAAIWPVLHQCPESRFRYWRTPIPVIEKKISTIRDLLPVLEQVARR